MGNGCSATGTHPRTLNQLDGDQVHPQKDGIESSKRTEKLDVHTLQMVENQIKSGQRRREECVLREIFSALAVGLSIPPQAIKAALNAAGADVSITEELIRCNPSGINYNDFKRAALSPSPLEMWASSIQLARILADALPISSQDDPLRRISVLSFEEIACIAEGVGAALKLVLTSEIESLHQAYVKLDAQTRSQTRVSKFQVECMHCGTIEDFHSGLYRRIGPCHLEFRAAMEAEHCKRPGFDYVFTTSNYHISSTPKREWEIATGQGQCSPEEMRGDRRLKDIDDLMEIDTAKQAGLTWPEVTAVVLYTGPMFQIYNAILRRHPPRDFEIFKRGGNLFATSIVVLVSAVQKVARVMTVPPGLKLYRGLGGKDFPESFSRRDSHGCMGYADWGFMSTTADKDVAVDYSGLGGPLPRLLEIRVGSVDRGACIREFSQYEREAEYLFVPCSFVEQEGHPRLEVTAHGVVSVYPVIVNANFKGQTVEEHLAQKKMMHVAAFGYLVDEIERELHARAVEGHAYARLMRDPSRDPNHTVPGLLDRIVRQCRDVLARHEATPAEAYTDDRVFRALVLEMLDVKSMAVSKLEEWLENEAGSFVRFRLNAQLRTVHRRWVAFLERQLLRTPEEQRKEKALRLCKMAGLVTDSVDELNDLQETRLMAAAAEGRSERDLRLLVQAGASVDAARPDGVTAIWLASQFGHTHAVMALADLGGDVGHAANDGATPVYIAAQGGNVMCVDALVTLKASVQVGDKSKQTPLHQAALNGHVGCVKALLGHGADVAARDSLDRTALDRAQENGFIECVSLLAEAMGEEASDRNRRQQNTNSNGLQQDKKLIISSGDVSDIDGFIALAEYAKLEADVLFVMNYPAYVGVTYADEGFAERNPGLGYRYTAREVFARDPPTKSARYAEFLKAYDGQNDNDKMKGAMTDVAFWVARSVWEESKRAQPNQLGGKLMFCIGGMNSVNPFSVAAIKNEVLVYSEVVPPSQEPLKAIQGAVYDAGTREQCMVDWRVYSEIYMDFNGSAAFWDEAWLDILSDAAARIKGFFIMGGVYADTKPVTMPSIPGKLNRFSSATMNQLYHPQRTAELLDFLRQCNVPTYVVTNNTVHEILHSGDEGLNCVDRFLAVHNLTGPTLVKCSRLHYGSVYAPPKKPFDLYTAVALGHCFRSEKTDELQAVPRTLHFSNTYGITCVGIRDASWDETRLLYISQINASPNQDDSAFDIVRKECFRKEISLVKSIEGLVAVPVFDLRFERDSTTGAIFLQQPAPEPPNNPAPLEDDAPAALGFK